MKKLFTLTGVFAGIYLVFLFVLYSSSLIFPSAQGVLYDCILEKNISAKELSDISKENKITTFSTEYNNTSFFDKDVIFNYFNNSNTDNISYGLQKRIIETNKILYKENSNKELKINRFWAIDNNEADFHSFSNALKKYGLQKEVFESHRMNFSVVFAEKNIEFFLYVVMFLIFCVSIYYILRSKEAAVLKLSGYNEMFISIKILAKVMKCIVIGYTLIGLVFSLYLALSDRVLIVDFLKLYLYIFWCLCVVMGIMCMVGGIFVKISKIIPALKNNKNNKLLILLLITFKIAITAIFIFSATHLYNDYLDYKLTNIGCSSMESRDFSYIKTSKTPEQKLMNDILLEMDKIDFENIYNYSNPTNTLYGHEGFNEKKREAMIIEPPMIIMSHNMLKYIEIYSDDGSIIDEKSLDAEEIFLLLPTNLKSNTNAILKQIDNNYNIKVKYIKEKQEHFVFLNPSKIVYNAVYLLKPVERSIYFSSGRVILDKKSAIKMEESLANNIGVDKGTVSLINLESEYKKALDNMQLKFIDNLQLFFINILSFFLAIIAVAIVYCEFRKKEIAILKISSQKPMRVIYMLCGINVAITVVISLFINPILIVLCGLEIFIYLLIVHLYYSKKAVGILKGE